MKKLALTILLGAGMLASTGEPARAFFCSNCATEPSMLMSIGKQVQEITNQIQAYQLQIQQYENAVQNTIALPQRIWGNVTGQIMAIRGLASQASVLTGSSGSILSRLNSMGYYANSAMNLPMMIGNMNTWQSNIQNNLRTMGQSIGLQQNQEQSDAAVLAQIQAQAASAQGQMQALQAGNELAGQTVGQLQKIQSTLDLTAQMQANQMLVDADREATYDGQWTQFVSPTIPVETGRSW